MWHLISAIPRAPLLRYVLLSAGMLPFLVPVAGAELAPHQVMIVANANSPESLMVAKHYATRRGISLQHIVEMDLPFEDTISRKDYEDKLVTSLRRALQTKGIERQIRVLVTVYGVPLRVSLPVLTYEERRWRLDAQDRLALVRSSLLSVKRSADEIAGGSGSRSDLYEKGGQGSTEFERHLIFLNRIDAAVEGALKRTKALDPSMQTKWHVRLEKLIQQYQGSAGLAQLSLALPRRVDESKNSASQETLTQQSEGLQLLLASLELPVRRGRDTLYRQVEHVYGLYGVFALAALELKRLSTEHADASVDSELSLLWWDSDEYGIAWRQINSLYHGFKRLDASGRDIPLLMVSRLDGPTAQVASRLVDRAIEAEQQGLAGTFYLDARGLPATDKVDTYGRYDQSLRDLDEYVRQHAAYTSILENTEKRFQKPGEAPDVALYVGWYRLRQYEDAFVFRPGAIGYHMASAEAVSLHTRSESGWCKNALEHGITATLGSVGEPYLDSFPEPLEFVALLMTGEYSLVEAYYLTTRWVSWRMVLVGDPLYNPWKKHPAARRASLSMFPLAPIAPSDRIFEDPLLARQDLKRIREQSRTRLETILQDQITAHAK